MFLKMKIAYATDIHGDYENLENLVKFSNKYDMDVLVVAGDIIDTPFLDKKAMEFFIEINKKVYDFCNDNNISRETAITYLIKSKGKLKEFAEAYIGLISIAEEGMKKQYEDFSNILKKNNSKTFVLPGNYDGVCLDKIIKENIHKKSKEEGIVKIKGEEMWFAGYGSADANPADIPIELIFNYSPNSLYNHFKETEPDVLITHMPPQGIGDIVMRKDQRGEIQKFHAGCEGLTKYIIEEKPDLVLCGHIHNGAGFYCINNTVIVNPGPLNKLKGNSFAVIDISDSGVKTVDSYGFIDSEKVLVRKETRVDLNSEEPQIIEYNNGLILPV